MTMLKKKKKYKDMRTTCTKVTYNQMGEPQRMEISLLFGDENGGRSNESAANKDSETTTTRRRRRMTGGAGGGILDDVAVNHALEEEKDKKKVEQDVSFQQSKCTISTSRAPAGKYNKSKNDKSQQQQQQQQQTVLLGKTAATTATCKREAMARTIHILREILFGKIFRDAMSSSSARQQQPQQQQQQQQQQQNRSFSCSNNSSSSSTALGYILRFFCQTSFGATAIANERETALFHAILEFQHMSSFLRVMKRLLCIPGIKPFEDGVANFYFEVWCWLIQNDKLLVGGASDILHQHATDGGVVRRKNVNGRGSDSLLFGLEKIYLPIKCMMDCVLCVCRTNGNHFPPILMCKLQEAIKSKAVSQIRGEINSTDRKEEEQVNVDDVLEEMMKIMEEHDCLVQSLHDDIFSAGSHAMNLNTSLVVGKEKGRKKLKAFLQDFILLDDQRGGTIEHSLFVERLVTCFKLCCGMTFVDNELQDEQEEANNLSLQFIVHGEEQKFVDYVAFVGALYTFVTEEVDEIPPPSMFRQYLNMYHGTDMQHLLSIQKYVENVRIQTGDVSSGTARMDGDQEMILNLQRSMAKIRTYQESDFLAKWVISSLETENAFLRKQQLSEYKRGLSCPTTSMHSGENSCVHKEENTKPPLHIVEPYFFDSSLAGYVAIKCLDGNHMKNVQPSSHNENYGKCLQSEDNCSMLHVKSITNYGFLSDKRTGSLLDRRTNAKKSCCRDKQAAGGGYSNKYFQEEVKKNVGVFRSRAIHKRALKVSNQCAAEVADDLEQISNCSFSLRTHDMGSSSVAKYGIDWNQQEKKNYIRSSLGHTPNKNKKEISTFTQQSSSLTSGESKNGGTTCISDGGSGKILQISSDPAVMPVHMKRYDLALDEGNAACCGEKSVTPAEMSENNNVDTLLQDNSIFTDNGKPASFVGGFPVKNKNTCDNRFSSNHLHDSSWKSVVGIDGKDGTPTQDKNSRVLDGNTMIINISTSEESVRKHALQSCDGKSCLEDIICHKTSLGEWLEEQNTVNSSFSSVSNKFSSNNSSREVELTSTTTDENMQDEIFLMNHENCEEGIPHSEAFNAGPTSISTGHRTMESSFVQQSGAGTKDDSKDTDCGEGKSDIESTKHAGDEVQEIVLVPPQKSTSSEHNTDTIATRKRSNPFHTSDISIITNTSTSSDQVLFKKQDEGEASNRGALVLRDQLPSSYNNETTISKEEGLTCDAHASLLLFAQNGQQLSPGNKNQSRSCSELSELSYNKSGLLVLNKASSISVSDAVVEWKHCGDDDCVQQYNPLQVQESDFINDTNKPTHTNGSGCQSITTNKNSSMKHMSSRETSNSTCERKKLEATVNTISSLAKFMATSFLDMIFGMMYDRVSTGLPMSRLNNHQVKDFHMMTNNTLLYHEGGLFILGPASSGTPSAILCNKVLKDNKVTEFPCEITTQKDSLDHFGKFVAANTETVLFEELVVSEKDYASSSNVKEAMMPRVSDLSECCGTIFYEEMDITVAGHDKNNKTMPFLIYLLGDELLVGYDWQSIFLHTESELLEIVSKVLSVKKENLVCFLEKHDTREMADGACMSFERSEPLVGKCICIDVRHHKKLPRPAAMRKRYGRLLSREETRTLLSQQSIGTSLGLIYYRLRLGFIKDE